MKNRIEGMDEVLKYISGNDIGKLAIPKQTDIDKILGMLEISLKQPPPDRIKQPPLNHLLFLD